MLTGRKREGGRWKYGESNDRKDSLNYKDRAQLGTIADHAPDLLTEVANNMRRHQSKGWPHGFVGALNAGGWQA